MSLSRNTLSEPVPGSERGRGRPLGQPVPQARRLASPIILHSLAANVDGNGFEIDAAWLPSPAQSTARPAVTSTSVTGFGMTVQWSTLAAPTADSTSVSDFTVTFNFTP